MSDGKKKKKNVPAQPETEEKELVFLYDDDEVNPNYNKEADEERKARKAGFRRKLGIISGSVLGVLLLIYLGIALFFNSHFYYQTTINGNSFGLKSIKSVEEFMEEQVDGYVLTLQESDNTTETISGKDISLKYKKSDELKKALKSQNPFLWPKCLFRAEELNISIGVEYDEEALGSLISKLNCVTNPEPVESVSAKPVFENGQYVIQKEVYGDKVDVEKFTNAVKEHLNGFIDTLSMSETGSYTAPKFTSESQEVADAKKKMNEYLKANVTYDFSPHTEVVDASVISGWLTVDGDMNVTFNKDKVKEYIKGLAGKYDTSGKPRSFVTANGNTVQVKNGVYGWKINQDEEYNKLVANIEAGETVKREPEYKRRAVSHEGNDFGNTYAEVDLTTQKMWFFKDGKLMMSSDIVTGNPNNGNATPQGTYTVTYTQRDAVLRGPLKADGTREWESPVDFWMPFNGGIGFHDATWQSAFGGSRYKTHGSHGCVNMPYEKAKELFSYLKAGTPVICHY